ncbi:MAG: putative hydrolase of the HAD superfamily [Oceanicoccus sp.]|jgi:putative hydrolase of the HAD superfamily
MTQLPIKVITFDLDDTLWHVNPTLKKADADVYRWLQENTPLLTKQFSTADLAVWRINIYKQNAEFKHQISQLRIIALQHALEKVGYKTTQAESLSLQAFDVFLAARHEVVFFDTALPLLQQLKTRFTLGALSNGNADIFKLEAGSLFSFAFSAEQLNASKPLADQFHAAASAANVELSQIIHIGDNIEHDVMGAQQAGCHGIWFNPTQQATPANIMPRQQVQCLSEIPQAIERIIAAGPDTKRPRR